MSFSSRLSRWCSAFLLTFAAVLCAGVAARGAEIHLAQGVLAGEVTGTTALLQTRLTSVAVLTDGDVAGAPGVARFEFATAESFADARQTGWLTASAQTDFIVRAHVDGLKPGTQYFYRAVFGQSQSTATKRSAIARFRTLPAPNANASISFVLTSCLNYGFFREGAPRGVQPAYQGADRDLGYPALEPLTKLQPDFVIFDGDCVYYDHPVATRAQTQPELRKKWHEQYVQPRFV
jgi:alkaline phosphatase D